jgi:N-acetylglucosamine kinase-like BadF-type ATPase
MGRHFLGIDGGQSATVAFIGDEQGRVIGVGKGGPCNHVGPAERRAKFLAAMCECRDATLASAGLPEDTEFDAACLGFSGGPDDKRDLLAEVLHCRKILVTTDAVIALTGATGGEPGIITIAGTGSISHGRNAGGRTARAGGWGYVFGDEGGAFDIFRQALRAVLRHEEGWGPPTPLREAILKSFDAPSANVLMHEYYRGIYPRSQVAQFAREVEQAAGAKDAIAQEILRSAAGQLVLITRAVRRQLFQQGEAVRIAWAGGVFQCEAVRTQFAELLEQEAGNQVSPPLHPPAAGALLEAYRLAGLKVSLEDVPGGPK